jgi:hypothetical protein
MNNSKYLNGNELQNMEEIKQIKTKERVVNHGEVYTPEWVVQDMLDMLPEDVTTIETRYLEPGTGEGVFLEEVLRRKLIRVFETYTEPEDIEYFTLKGVANIYGLELLIDNVQICRERLLNIVVTYFKNRNLAIKELFIDTVKFILENNIMNINALTFGVPIFNANHELVMTENGDITYKPEKAVISEWDFDDETKTIQRTIFNFEDVVKENRDRYELEKDFEKKKLAKIVEQIELFDTDDNGQLNLFDVSDDDLFISKAKPQKVFERIHFSAIMSAEDLTAPKVEESKGRRFLRVRKAAVVQVSAKGVRVAEASMEYNK